MSRDNQNQVIQDYETVLHFRPSESAWYNLGIGFNIEQKFKISLQNLVGCLLALSSSENKLVFQNQGKVCVISEFTSCQRRSKLLLKLNFISSKLCSYTW